METKDPKSTESTGADAGTESKDPKAFATSDETLHDVEEKEAVPEQSDTSSEAASASSPSPDGMLDDRRDGPDDAGPM